VLSERSVMPLLADGLLALIMKSAGDQSGADPQSRKSSSSSAWRAVT
jgi:hypothetical protein